MIADIGTELVPVVKKNYNADAPIHGNILASTFLENFWGKSSELYLHQWQFTLSLSAGTKMCNKNSPLPFMGIDLLSSWLDLPQLNHDNPLQYIFMGSKGTFSRLHQDNGGLVITIAPIVGEKEAVMVHRDDHMCLYHGEVRERGCVVREDVKRRKETWHFCYLTTDDLSMTIRLGEKQIAGEC